MEMEKCFAFKYEFSFIQGLMPRAIWALNIIFLRALTVFSGPRLSYFVNWTYNGIIVASKFALWVNFEGPQASLPHLILTPGFNTSQL